MANARRVHRIRSERRPRVPEGQGRHGSRGLAPGDPPLCRDQGATTEIRKEEGITYDPDHHRLYVAISEISNGMEDAASKGKPSGKYDLADINDIKVGYNPCGGVYALDLDESFVA